MTIFLIFLLILAIIINIIISNSINENFATSPDKLIYLFNTERNCPSCKDFDNTWVTIENEVKANPFFYKFITDKYNIENDSQGIKIAKDNKINTPPAIIYISGDNYKIYKEKSTDMSSILDWARQINGI